MIQKLIQSVLVVLALLTFVPITKAQVKGDDASAVSSGSVKVTHRAIGDYQYLITIKNSGTAWLRLEKLVNDIDDQEYGIDTTTRSIPPNDDTTIYIYDPRPDLNFRMQVVYAN